MSSNGALSAQGSPQRLAGVGVRRLNNMPLYLICGVAIVSLGLICYVAMERGSQQAKPQEDDHGGSASQQATALAGDRTGGVVPRASAPPSPIASATPVASPAASTPVVQASPTPDELERQRRAAYAAALRAKSGVEGGAFQQIAQQRQQKLTEIEQAALRKADPNNAQDVIDEYRRQLAQAQAMIGQNGMLNGQQNPNSLAAYNGNNSRWTLASRREHPTTPYLLRAGAIIPAVLITGMDSDLPGVIKAQVSQNVYDTATGTQLLIPQGSMLLGEYSSSIKYGQNRVFVAWQRITFPDASVFDIGAFPGADEAGQAGFHDRTDTHFLRTFGSALLMSAITAGVTLSQPHYGGGYGNGISASDALSEALGQNLGMAMSQLLEKNLNVAPTLKIRAGYRFNVLAVKDVTFDQPYRVPNY